MAADPAQAAPPPAKPRPRSRPPTPPPASQPTAADRAVAEAWRPALAKAQTTPSASALLDVNRRYTSFDVQETIGADVAMFMSQITTRNNNLLNCDHAQPLPEFGGAEVAKGHLKETRETIREATQHQEF